MDAVCGMRCLVPIFGNTVAVVLVSIMFIVIIIIGILRWGWCLMCGVRWPLREVSTVFHGYDFISPVEVAGCCMWISFSCPSAY